LYNVQFWPIELCTFCTVYIQFTYLAQFYHKFSDQAPMPAARVSLGKDDSIQRDGLYNVQFWPIELCTFCTV
jgi:hypothetical protein